MGETIALKPCASCRERPRLRGQRWCRRYLTTAPRERRAARREQGRTGQRWRAPLRSSTLARS